jgi:hypothetical protein
MFLMRGVPTGTGGTTVLRNPKEILQLVPLHPEGCLGGERPGIPVVGSSKVSYLRRGEIPMKGLRMEEILLFESLPGKGNEGRWIAFRNPVHMEECPGTFFPWLGGSQVPSVRPDDIPEGISSGFLGGALEVWKPFGFLSPKG